MACDPRSIPGGKVSRLTLYLNVVHIALAALEQETTDARVVAANAQARMIGKVSFINKLYPNVNNLVLTVFSVVSPRGVGRFSRGGPYRR